MVTHPDEQTALDELARRLADRYPNVTSEIVKAAVKEAADGFSQAHVRDFIPVLVERRAKQTLRSLELS